MKEISQIAERNNMGGVKFVNPELDSTTLILEPRKAVTDRIVHIMCDKYGFEGDCTLYEVANDIYDELFKIVF